MRSAVLIAVGVFLIVVIGAGSAAWYMQAQEARKIIEQLAQTAKARQIDITYDALETSGFPSEIRISIVNPRMTGRMDTLVTALKDNLPADPKQPPVKTDLPQWYEDLSLDGTVTLSINALSNHYQMTTSGTWHDNAKIGDETHSFANRNPESSICVLELDRGSNAFGKLWNFKTLTVNDGFADLRLLDCVFPPSTLAEDTSNTVLMSSGGGRIYVSHTPQGAQQQIRVVVQSKDAEITAAGDALVAAYMHALSSETAMPAVFSKYGKQNMDMDFSYAGPAGNPANTSEAPLDINLSKFIITNQVYNTDIAFRATNGMSGENRMAQVTFKAHSSFADQYDMLLQESVRRYVEQLYATKPPLYTQFEPVMQKYSPDEMYRIISPAIPRFHSLGDVKQSLDLSYQGKSDFSAGTMTIAELDLSATPYGIQGKGTASKTPSTPLPAVNIGLTCNNCLQLVDDIADYSNRLQKVAIVFKPEQTPSIGMSPALAEGLKAFLRTLAESAKEPADSDHLTYTIVSDGTPNATVNDKPLDEVMGLYNQYLAPALQPQAGVPQAPHPAQVP